MSFDSKTGACNCSRCFHFWIAEKKIDGKFIEPRACAGCKQTGWNQVRVYGGKYLNGSAAMARRWKPTGRKSNKDFRESLQLKLFE